MLLRGVPTHNNTLDQTGSSHSLPTAGQRERSVARSRHVQIGFLKGMKMEARRKPRSLTARIPAGASARRLRDESCPGE